MARAKYAKEQVNLYHPRFVGYWLLLGGVWLVVQVLPQKGRMALGAGLGRLLLACLPYRRKIVAINIAKAFPELDADGQRRLLRAFARSLGMGVMETAMAWFLSEKRLRGLCRFEADEKALALLEDKQQGVVLLGLHSTLLELGVRLLGLNVDSAGMYKPLRNRFFDAWIYRQRSRAATRLVQATDMRQTLRILAQGENLWYALDQDMGARASVFAPFFGIEAASVNILPRLKQKTGARWVPVFIWRERGGRGYVVRVYPEVDLGEKASDVAVMTEVNRLFEQEIRRYPEQYYWVHRRFKHRPDGQAHEYPNRR